MAIKGLLVVMSLLLTLAAAFNLGYSDSSDWEYHESSSQSQVDSTSSEQEEGTTESSARHFPGLMWHFTYGGRRPWWEGENVCETQNVEEKNATTGADSEEPVEIRRHYSTRLQTCEESESVYKCTITELDQDGFQSKLVMLYECCRGFTRNKGDDGCPRRFELRDIVALANDLGLKDFLRSVRKVGLEEELRSREVTVFAPVDGGFGGTPEIGASGPGGVLLQRDAPYTIIETDNPVDRAEERIQSAILGHVISGSRRSSSFHDEEVIETGGVDASTIRINFFYVPEKKVVTANCVPVVSGDNLATNGVIHSVERFLPRVEDSFLDMVKSRADLSTLKTILAAARYVPKLDENGQGTLLAPSNGAFARMNPRLRQRLLAGDRKCLQKILDNHLLPYTICSSVIQGKSRTPNQLGKYLNLSRSEDGKLFVHGAQITERDLMATNGVMHVIDKVIVPHEAMDLLDLLDQEGFTDLLDLVQKAGLTKTLATADNITVFAPTNAAIQKLPQRLRSQLARDPELLRQVLSYHVSPGVVARGHLHYNQLLPTLAGDSRIRMETFALNPFHHYAVVTAQCAPLTDTRIEACNGRIRALEEVMIPPRGTVLDVLARDKKFNQIISFIKWSGLADLLQESGPFTIFAPNNMAIQAMGQSKIKYLRRDKERMKTFLKQHIHKGNLCCAGIFRTHSWLGSSRVRVLTNERLRVSRDYRNTPKVDDSRIVTCDLTATNGNVMELDSVLEQGEWDHPWRRRSWEGRRRRYPSGWWWDHFPSLDM